MASKQDSGSDRSQNLDGAVFGAYLLGAVVPLVGLGLVAHHYALPMIQDESRLSAGLIGAIVGTGVLSLASFFAMRRVTFGAIEQMDGDNRRLQQLLVVARALPASAHASDAAQLAATSACELTGADAGFVIVGSAADKPLAINGSAGERAAICEQTHADEIYEVAALSFAGGVQRCALDPGGVAIALPLSCSSGISGAIVLVSEAGDFAPEVRDVAETLAALTSVAIDNADLREAQRNFFAHMTDLLVTALDLHVEARESHATQVARTANRIGRELEIEDEQLQHLHFASLLHDLGMLKIPSDQQRNPAQFRRHTQIGHRLLTRIKVWEELAPIVLYHHERWDGGGYPEGLAGDAIPLESRIIHVADAFDAMTRDDVHRHAMSLPDALAELHDCAGSQFDPRVVDALARIAERNELD